MASMVGGLIGGAVGSFFGPVGAEIGQAVGSYVFGSLFAEDQNVQIEGPRLGNLSAAITSPEGSPIPICYGVNRVSGKIIWSTGLKETKHVSTQSVGGKGGGGASQTTTSYTYSTNIAVGVCEGPITAINKIWIDKRLVYRVNKTTGDIYNKLDGKIRIYKGTETQQPDATIQAYEGAANVSAHRGLAYVVLSEMELETYGNRIPVTIEFEVMVTGSLSTYEYNVPTTDMYSFAEHTYYNTQLTPYQNFDLDLYASKETNTYYAIDYEWDEEVISPSAQPLYAKIITIDPFTGTKLREWPRMSINADNSADILCYFNIQFVRYNPVAGTDELFITRPISWGVSYYSVWYKWTPLHNTLIELFDMYSFSAPFFSTYPKYTITESYDNQKFIYQSANGTSSYVDLITLSGGTSLFLGDSISQSGIDLGAANEYPEISQVTGIGDLIQYIPSQPVYQGVPEHYSIDGSALMGSGDQAEANLYAAIYKFDDDYFIHDATTEEEAQGYSDYIDYGTYLDRFYITRADFHAAADNASSYSYTSGTTIMTNWVPRYITEAGGFILTGFEEGNHVYIEIDWNDFSVIRKARYLGSGTDDSRLSDSALWRYNANNDTLVVVSNQTTESFLICNPDNPLDYIEDPYYPDFSGSSYTNPLYDPDLRKLYVGNNNGTVKAITNFAKSTEGNTTVRSIIDDISDRVNLPATNRQYTDVNTTYIKGYMIDQRIPARGGIIPLLDAYFLDSFESGENLYVKRQHITKDIIVPIEDIIGEEKFTIERQSLIDGIKDLTLKYRSYNRSLQTSTKNAKIQAYSLENKETIETAIVFTDAEADTLVGKLLRNRWERFSLANIKLPKKYERIQPGDIITITGLEDDVVFRVSEINREPGHMIDIKGTTVLPSDFVYSPEYSANYDAEIQFYNNKIIPILVVSEVPYNEYLFANTNNKTIPLLAISKSPLWEGSTFSYSFDDSIYVPFDTKLQKDMPLTGYVTKVTGASTTDSIIDTNISIDIRKFSDYGTTTLGSKTDADFYTQVGSNLAVVLDNKHSFKEYIRFKTVAYADGGTDPDNFTLTNIQRGVTNNTVSTLQAGDFVIFLDDRSNVSPFNYSSLNINNDVYFKTNTLGSSEYSSPTSLNITGKSLQTNKPFDIKGLVNGTSIDISWNISSIYSSKPFWDEGKIPDYGWVFRVEIYDKTNTTLIRTYDDLSFASAASDFTVTYTAGDMSTDSVTTTTPLLIKVYRYEEILGYRAYGIGQFSPNDSLGEFFSATVAAPLYIDAPDTNTVNNLVGTNGTYHSTNSNATGLVFPNRHKKGKHVPLLPVGNETAIEIPGVITPSTTGVAGENWTIGFSIYIPASQTGTTNLFEGKDPDYGRSDSGTTYTSHKIRIVDGKIMGSGIDYRGSTIYVIISKRNGVLGDSTYPTHYVYVNGKYVNIVDDTSTMTGTSLWIGQASATPADQSVCYVGDIFYKDTYSSSSTVADIYNVQKNLRGF